MGTRHQARAPGSGSPVPACAGMFCSCEPASDNKKPSGASGSGGFAATGLVSVRLCEIAPISRACAIDWRGAIRQPDELFVPVVHERTLVVSRTKCPRGRGTYARNFLMSSRRVRENCDSWRDSRKQPMGVLSNLGFVDETTCPRRSRDVAKNHGCPRSALIRMDVWRIWCEN